MAKTHYSIAVIPGDGIGPELTRSARLVLDAVAAECGLHLTFTEENGGAQTYLDTGASLDPAALDRFRTEYDAVLKGPVGLPGVRAPDGTEAGLLGGVMRIGLDAYANVRPIVLLPGIRTATTHKPGQIDYVIVRENTEGLYLSRGAGVATPSAACDQLLVTRSGAERVARFAFELATKRNGAPIDGVSRVTCVDKSNVLRSYALFRTCVQEVAHAYPTVELDFLYADAAGYAIVADPGRFDVLVTENFIGDLLSDVGAATVGGLGMCPSGNIGAQAAYFEPIHGSAPQLAGKDTANPTSQILAASMMLEHLGATEAAQRIRTAVATAYRDSLITLDDRGCPTQGTRRTAQTIAQLI